MVPMEVSIRTDIGEMRVLVSWAAEDQREWMLLELQGSLSAESRPDLKGLVLGRVERVGEADSDEVRLRIGNHVLRGRKVRLEKPMAVTERRARTQGRTATLRVMAVVKYKILFAERPAPVVDGEQVQ